MSESNEKAVSKPLGHDDQSGFQFAQEMLCGDVTAAVNFDRLQKHPAMGYILFEYLLCDEKQTVTPHTSHPKWYWGRNKAKFLGLWRVARSLEATLYLVNYAKAGTLHEDKVRVIEVHDMDVDGIKEERTAEITRKEFSDWFRKLNRACMAGAHEIALDSKYDLFHMDRESIGEIRPDFGRYRGMPVREIAELPDNGDYSYILRSYKHR